MPTTDKRPLKVFLCHASADKPAVRNLYKRLIADGVDVWLDAESLVAGQNWHVEIPRAIRESDVVIVCLSEKSINKEGYVQKEIKFALDVADEKPEGTIFIVPAKLEECTVPDRLSMYHWVELFEKGGYEKLLRALRLRANIIDATLQKKKNNSWFGFFGLKLREYFSKRKKQENSHVKNETIPVYKQYLQKMLFLIFTFRNSPFLKGLNYWKILLTLVLLLSVFALLPSLSAFSDFNSIEIFASSTFTNTPTLTPSKTRVPTLISTRTQSPTVTSTFTVTPSATPTPNLTATSKSLDDQAFLEDLYGRGIIPSINGKYTKKDDWYSSSNSLGKYSLFYGVIDNARNFLLKSNLEWESASKYTELINKGCGFSFHDSDEGRYLATLSLDGYAHFFIGDDPEYLAYTMKTAYFGKVDALKDNASLVLAVYENRYTLIVNGQIILTAYGKTEDILDGSIEYVIFPGTVVDFGTRCSFTNTELWVFDE